ncbi:AAA family ATPase, partial [uncultured Brachyspira sp.]
MELQLRNIGMIKEADIILDGLTLIAGENDTGKSTVSKALYSIVAGLNNSEIYYNIYINNNILSILDDIKRILDNEIINKNNIDAKYHLLDTLLDDIKDINKNNKDDII